MSFGTTAVDHNRPVQAWPATSMLTGLLANALGWTRSQTQELDELQGRLRWAARIDRPGVPVKDFQTAQLGKDDKGWTTRGTLEEREGGEKAYKSPHLRLRDYRADASVLVALRLEPAERIPTLLDLATALDSPRRPLFLGRKGCPPSTRVGAGMVDAHDAVAALRRAPPVDDGAAPEYAQLFFAEDACRQPPAGVIVHRGSDERRFELDVHAGTQRVYEIPARPQP